LEELEKKYLQDKANHQNGPKEAKVQFVKDTPRQNQQQSFPAPDTDYKLLTANSLDSVDMKTFLMT